MSFFFLRFLLEISFELFFYRYTPTLSLSLSAPFVSPHSVNALWFFIEGICVATGGGAKVDGHHHHIGVPRRLILF